MSTASIHRNDEVVTPAQAARYADLLQDMLDNQYEEMTRYVHAESQERVNALRYAVALARKAPAIARYAFAEGFADAEMWNARDADAAADEFLTNRYAKVEAFVRGLP